MSLKMITEGVSFLVKDGALLTKVGAEIEQQDWQDTAMDALHLGLDLAGWLVPAQYLTKALKVPEGATLANDLIERLAENLRDASGDTGTLTLEDLFGAVRKMISHPDLLKDRDKPTSV